MKTTVSGQASGQTITRKRVKTLRPPVSEQPVLLGVQVTNEQIRFDLSDGRSILFPLAWSTKLSAATPEQRQQFTFTPYNVFWDDVDEIIGVENALYGNRLYL